VCIGEKTLGTNRSDAASGAANAMARALSTVDESDRKDVGFEDLKRLAACGEAIRALSSYCGPASRSLQAEYVNGQLNQAYGVFEGARDTFSSEDFAIYFLAHLDQSLQNGGSDVDLGIKAGASRYLLESARRLSPDIARLAVHVEARPDGGGTESPARGKGMLSGDSGRNRLRSALDNSVSLASKPSAVAPSFRHWRETQTGRPVDTSPLTGTADSRDHEPGLFSERHGIRRARVQLEDRLKMARQLRLLWAAVGILAVGLLAVVALLIAGWN
jgi:hypothetical protein